jgi:hypothetical protein
MYDFDDDFDGRNARRRRRVAVAPRPMGYPPGYPPYGGYPHAGAQVAMVPPQAPWLPSAAPAVDRFTGTLKLGVMVDAAAKALSAMSSLPTAPSMTGESRIDDQNLVKWIEAALTHFKRAEQIRTVGSLARLFLV